MSSHAWEDRWAGKTALITGASSGIGAAAARRLALAGMRVVLTARRAERLSDLAAEINTAGGTASTFPADLTSADDRLRLFEQVRAAVGSPDVLINNAGMCWYGYYAEMPWETVEQTLRLNVSAVTHLTSLFLPGMLTRGSGQIVNISSVAGSLPEQGVVIYAASKAFLDAYTTALYRELRGTGVVVSAVKPGPVSSEFYDRSDAREGALPLPARRFSISSERVAACILRVLNRPRRVVYVPGMLAITPWVEMLFGGVIDRLGPLLLRRARQTAKSGYRFGSGESESRRT